ncbi:MAG TPA: aldose epimerase family protein [Chitinophagaceae bacterium]|jgi:aldose 1-epimerase|nr:aldose epimerase family protein [Chitinophagaceae bacterium]
MEKAGQFCFTHPSGKDIYLYSLRNANGTEALITNYGATLMAYKIHMPDNSMNDIVLGFDNVVDYLSAEYLNAQSFMGAAIGRYTNRIKNASFKIDDKEFPVSKNWGSNQLHGGFEGFDKKVWDFVSFDEKSNILQLKYNSPDGEEGFPGNLDVHLCFELNDENDLIYIYTAHCDQPTVINLTHHSYFNLNNGEGTITDHEIKINSDKVLEQDEDLVTTGNYIAVDNTRYDFREFRSIGEGLNGGYDQSFVIDKKTDQLSIVAEALSKDSGLKLQILTNEPLVHLYTGQGLSKIKGKNDVEYGPYSGFCLETHKHPNAINISKFPNTILRPGEKYTQKNVYKICKL